MGCPTCGLEHSPETLFVEVGRGRDGNPIFDETCVLAARLEAEPDAAPEGSVAYHGTRNAAALLAEGLVPQPSPSGCAHICLALRPEVAANFGEVLVVDASGLRLNFELGEARHHGS